MDGSLKDDKKDGKSKEDEESHQLYTCSEGHAKACGEPSNGQDVVEAARSHHQRGDALLHTVAIVLEQQHSRNHHCWSHSTQHKTTNRRFWKLSKY